MSRILYFYSPGSKSPIWELLGQLGDRQVFYCTIRSDKNWSAKINIENWVGFTIAMKRANINFDEGFWFAATVAQQIINEGSCL